MKKEDHNAVPDSLLSKEFLSQFMTEDDVKQVSYEVTRSGPREDA